jgi:PAS domain S-box-containing protein
MMTEIITGKKKRSRWLWLTGALFLFVVLAVLAWKRNSANESADPLTVTERAWLKDHPVIRLAPDPDFPPVEYFAGNGDYSGITADYVALLEKRLGIRIEIVRLRDWDEVISKAKSRQIDVYVATETPQRAGYMLFTKPFLEFPVVIIARGNVKDPLTLEKLNGMKVSVVSEYAAQNFIAYNYPKLSLDPVPDVRTGLHKVSFGLSDAFVENLATATYYIEKEGFTNLRIAGDTGYVYRMGFCSRKDWPELNRILEKGLAALNVAEKQAMYKKWIPVEPRSLFTSREFRTGLLAVVAAILLMVSGVIAWNRALARQVRLRTGELENELAERRRVEEELYHAREDLEKRVEERTTELRCAKERLEEEICVRNRTERVITARLRLLEFAATHTMDELLQSTIDEAEALTDSLIGFYHFLEADQKTLSLQNWSSRTREQFCEAEGKGSGGHCDVSAEGGWVDCIHERRPVIHNDHVSLPQRRGMSPEHVQLVRELVVPVFRGDTIVAILGVGNKPQDYTAEDVEAVSLLADLAWEIVERKQAEEALRESESWVRRKLESILDPEGDIGELDLADILDAPQIQSLMDDLYRIAGLKMSIIDLKGRVLVDVGWQDICSKFHRIHPETRKRCLESDSDLTVGVARGEFRTYRCKNNMWHLVTPIIVGERHMGNLFLGQFFFENEKIDYDLFRSQARTYGFPEEEYIAALEAVPRHSEELVNLGKAVSLRLTDMFSKLSYANIKLAHFLAERDRLTATLRAANMVVENSPVVLFRWKGDDEWPVELVSGNITQFGYTPEDFLSGSITYSSILHPDDRERVTREVHDFCTEGAGQFRLEYRIMAKDGDIRWVNELTHVERDAAGGVTNFEGIVIDVTERKRMEEELRDSREKYSSIVEAYDGLIYICSQDYRIEFMNRKLIERTGCDGAGGFCYEALHGRDSVCPWCVNERVFSGETVHWEIQSPKDGRWYHVVNVPIYHANGTISKQSVIADIHDLKLTEEKLREQKQQLEELNTTLEKRVQEGVAENREKDIVLILQNRQAALGEMLDHIAHQWKQPLTSISFILQDLGDTASEGGLANEFVEETVIKAMALVQHMAQTIDTFRGFYRPDKEKKVFNIKDTIDQALAFIAPAFRFHSIAVELDVDPGLTAFGYPKEYAQVLLNILANARDIFMARGTENPRVVVRAFAEDNKAVVTITDNGGGIPEAIIGRIFDFYFTTNEAGGGTGIGLYMSRNIIEKNMGGTLRAENKDGGARFRIEIPPA